MLLKIWQSMEFCECKMSKMQLLMWKLPLSCECKCNFCAPWLKILVIARLDFATAIREVQARWLCAVSLLRTLHFILWTLWSESLFETLWSKNKSQIAEVMFVLFAYCFHKSVPLQFFWMKQAGQPFSLMWKFLVVWDNSPLDEQASLLYANMQMCRVLCFQSEPVVAKIW